MTEPKSKPKPKPKPKPNVTREVDPYSTSNWLSVDGETFSDDPADLTALRDRADAALAFLADERERQQKVHNEQLGRTAFEAYTAQFTSSSILGGWDNLNTDRRQAWIYVGTTVRDSVLTTTGEAAASDSYTGTRPYTLHTTDSPKALREALCIAQLHLPEPNQPYTRHRLARLIADIDVARPLGSDGKHGDRHTPFCGCEDK